MSGTITSVLDYYAAPGLMTDPGEYGPLFAGLPRDVGGLCWVVQGLMVHIFWAERYGLKLDGERQKEVQIRPVDAKLARIVELDAGPLTVERPLERRLVGNCRDFSVMLCAMLRHQGVPARARCGFGTYFLPNHYEDHWVCEYWSASEKRWRMVDPQLDSLQREVLGIDFDTCDMPAGRFVTGGEAWRRCRRGEADPESFGILDMKGLWFVCGDLLRDFMALNKVEILPWDPWGLMFGPGDALTAEDAELLDEIAALTVAGDEAFPRLRALAETEPRLQPPPGWPSA